MGFWTPAKVVELLAAEGCHLRTNLGRLWVGRDWNYSGWQYSIGGVSFLSETQASQLLNLLAAFPPRPKPQEAAPADGG